MERTQISGVCCAPWAELAVMGSPAPSAAMVAQGSARGEGTLDTAFPRAGALQGGLVPSRSVVILGFQALFSA